MHHFKEKQMTPKKKILELMQLKANRLNCPEYFNEHVKASIKKWSSKDCQKVLDKISKFKF